MPKKEFTKADARRLMSVASIRKGRVEKDTLAAIAQSTVDQRSKSGPSGLHPAGPAARRPPNGPSKTGRPSGKNRGSNPPSR